MSKVIVLPSQCRMARAYLGWSQPDLARICGLSPQTISNFEGEAGNPEARTLGRIASVFEVAGVRLLPTGGVEPSNSLVTVLDGPDANAQLLDDIYRRLAPQGGEVLIAGLSEVAETAIEERASIEHHIQRLQDVGITERILIRHGDRNLVAPADWYRWLKDNRFSDTPFQTYGNRIALIDWGPPTRIVIIDHPKFAATFRNLFDAVWHTAEPVANGGRA